MRRLRPLLRPLSSGERRSSERALSELLSDTTSYASSSGPDPLKPAERLENGATRGVQGPAQPWLLDRAAVRAKQERAALFKQLGASQEMDS